MRKIMFAIGSRAHYARIKPIINELVDRCDYSLLIFDTASILLPTILEQDMLMEKSIILNTHEQGQNLKTMSISVGKAICEISKVVDNVKPDLMVVVADRYEIMAPSIVARYMNICLVHIQGGEITGTVDDCIRHTVSKLSNYHFVSNEVAKATLELMGENSNNIYITGCPTMDLIRKNKADMRKKLLDFWKNNKVDCVPKYIVVNYHPVTTDYEKNYENIKTLYYKIRKYTGKIIWLEPNYDAGSNKLYDFINHVENNNNIVFIKNVDSILYLSMLMYCDCIVGNSSVGIRESSYMGIPSISIGTRQESRECAENVIRISDDCSGLMETLNYQIAHGKYPASTLYGDGYASNKIADLLLSIKIEKDKFFKRK